MTLAEIADKMPSAAGVIACATAAAALSGGIASINRIVAWSMLLLTLVVGCLLACLTFADALSGPLRDAVWSELGWPWVVANVLAPLVPAACVAGVLAIRPRQSATRGFPLDEQPSSQ